MVKKYQELIMFFARNNKKGYATGFSENYLKVRTPWNPKLANTIQEIELVKIDEEGFLRF